MIPNHIVHILDLHYCEVFNFREALGVDELLCYSCAFGICNVWQTTCNKHLTNCHLGGLLSSSVFAGVTIRSVPFSLFPFLDFRWSVWFSWPPQLIRLTQYAYCQWPTDPDCQTSIDVVETMVPPLVLFLTGNSLYGHEVFNRFPLSLLFFFLLSQ